jgi:hypothetical protein
MKKPKLESWNWTAEKGRGCKDIVAGNDKIAVCFTSGMDNETQDKRNARMITAAPLMALALESIYRNDKDGKIRAVAKEALEAAGYTF